MENMRKIKYGTNLCSTVFEQMSQLMCVNYFSLESLDIALTSSFLMFLFVYV